jgi:hypothetical protein
LDDVVGIEGGGVVDAGFSVTKAVGEVVLCDVVLCDVVEGGVVFCGFSVN